MPYILVLEAYNEAGEKVKSIARTQVSSGTGDFQLLVNNKQADVFNPVDATLIVSFPGVNSTDQTGGVSLAWDGTTENGGTVNQGNYYIKATIIDNYGHVNTNVRQIMLLKTEQFVRINIYNTAGELAVRAVKNLSAAGNVSLVIEDTVYVGGGAAPVMIKYTDVDYLQWDGKNMQGRAVDSGIYELVLEIKNKDGSFITQTSAIFTVLNMEDDTALAGLKSYPNPCVIDSAGSQPIIFNWQNKQKGRIFINIYNVAGEIVRKLEGNLDAPAGITWDGAVSTGRMASSGFYTAVVRVLKPDGAMEVRILKPVIINRYSSGNNNVN